MKEFKYTIDGKEYNVEIGDINEETYVASVKVNGEAYEVGMEKPAEPEKKKVELGKPVAESNEESAAPPPLTPMWQTPPRLRCLEPSQLST